MATKRWGRLVVPLALLAAVVALNLASLAVSTSQQRAARLPGMTVVRPPEDVSALVLWDGVPYAGGQEGLFVVDPADGTAEMADFDGDLPADHVRALLAAEGALWVGGDSGLFRFDGEDVRPVAADALPSLQVRSLVLDSEGRVWVGTVAGAIVLEDDDVVRTWTVGDDLAADVVNAIAQDATGRMWLGSYDVRDGGITVIEDEEVVATFTTADGLPHPSVTCIMPEDDGTVWVGTGFHDRGGLARFSASAGGPIELDATFVHEDGLAGPKVRSLWRSPSGVLWIGSERDGIALWPGSSPPTPPAQVLTTDAGISDNEVKQFAPLTDGHLLLGTRSGITILDDAAAIEHSVIERNH